MDAIPVLFAGAVGVLISGVVAYLIARRTKSGRIAYLRRRDVMPNLGGG